MMKKRRSSSAAYRKNNISIGIALFCTEVRIHISVIERQTYKEQ